MKSKLHPRFRREFEKLPMRVQHQARAAYRRFSDNPQHPGLEFKRLTMRHPLWSARINDNYRTVGVRNRDEIIWFFIGTHAEYDKLLAEYR